MVAQTVGVFLFNSFELLDVTGPVQMWASNADNFRVLLLGPSVEPIDSSVGPNLAARFMPDDV